MKMRPRLLTFRVEAFHSENRAQGRSGVPWKMEIQQEIQVGLGRPATAGGPLQAQIRVVLSAKARDEETGALPEAQFKGEYAAQFEYLAETTEAEVQALLGEEEHQYLLVAQTFPLAMMHFRRELMATGFDSRELPLGI